MYCKNCGHEISKTDLFCASCGQRLSPEPTQNAKPRTRDGNIAFGVISFFIPIAGLILFICWRKEYPKNSKYSGIGAIIGGVVQILFYIFFFMMIYGILNSQN